MVFGRVVTLVTTEIQSGLSGELYCLILSPLASSSLGVQDQNCGSRI